MLGLRVYSSPLSLEAWSLTEAGAQRFRLAGEQAPRDPPWTGSSLSTGVTGAHNFHMELGLQIQVSMPVQQAHY